MSSTGAGSGVLKEGGALFYGWWIVGAGFCIALFTSGFIFFGFTALIEPVAREMGWSYAQVSFAASLRGLEVGMFAPILGFLVDRLGPRRLIVGGALIAGAGLLLLSRVTSLPAFYGAFVLLGLGTSACIGVVPVTAVNTWFHEKATMATAVLVSGTAMGGLLVPLATRLIDGLGWRTAVAVLAFLTWGCLVPLGLVFRHRPEQYGHLPDGGPGVAPGPRRASVHLIGPDGTAFHALRTRAFWQISFGIMTHMFAVAAVTSHVMPYLGTIGISRATAALVAGALPIVSVCGRLGFGWLGDRFDKRRVAASGLGLTALGLVFFGGAAGNGTWLLVPFLLFMGVGYGGPVPMLPALIREYFGRSMLGAVLGLALGAGAVGSIAGPPFAGWVFDTFGSYQGAWFALVGLVAIGMISLLSAPPAMNTILTRLPKVAIMNVHTAEHCSVSGTHEGGKDAD